MSASGFISISAISVLANPRAIDPQKGSRNIVLDANFYVVEGSKTSCLALLRYFVPDDMLSSMEGIFQSNFRKAFIVANISSITKDTIPPTLLSDDIETTDYAFIGDIVQLTLLSEDINENVRPYISAMGSITHTTPNNNSFDMAPSQYIAVPHCSSTFPLHGYFVESKRWGDRKTPKLFVGSTIAFGGFIDKIRQERDIDCTVAAVNIEVITIVFLPTHTTFQSNPSSPNTQSKTSRSRWNYQNPTQPSPPHVASSSKQSSPSQRKRKRSEPPDNRDDTTPSIEDNIQSN